MRLKEKAANATINRELSLLQRSFMLGYESQPRKVARPLRFHRLAESKPRQGFIEQKEFHALVKNCADLWLRTLLTLAYSFGFRREELVTLEVSDVNLLDGMLQLRDSKNGESRKVALTGDTKNLLAACVTGKGPEDFVFTRGMREVKGFRELWKKSNPGRRRLWLALARYAPQCRAEHGPWGIPETVAMQISGHKTRDVFDRYNVTSERDLTEAAKKIESAQLRYRQAKTAETEENTKEENHVRIQ